MENEEASESSHASSSSSLSLAECVKRICRRMSTAANSLSDHASASGYMRRARDLLVEGGRMKPQTCMNLVLTGVYTLRTAHRMDVHVDGEAIEAWRRSALLIFVLLCLNHEIEEGDSAGVVEAFSKQCLWDHLSAAGPTRKRRRGEEGEGVDVHTWQEVLYDPGHVASAALREGVVCLYEADASERMCSLSSVFFQCSAARIAKQLLKDDQVGSSRDDFLTLSVSGLFGIVNDNDERIHAIVSAAESEAGQQTIRDVALSFLLPPDLVGVRKMLVLERSKSTRATVEYAEIVQRCHELAMQGAEWTYANSTAEFDRMIVLLSGLALLTTRGGDVLRKADAFGGRLQLPFLETVPPEAGVRATLIPSENRWVLYRLRRGVPEILASKRGMDGLRAVCLELGKR